MQRIARTEDFAVQLKRTAIRTMSPTEHFHERTFTGAIFTDQCVHLTGGNLEAHPTQCHRRPEPLGHIRDSQPRKTGFS